MKATADATEYVDLKTAAERLHLTPRTLRLWAVRYNLPMIQTGRIIRFNWAKLAAAYESKFSTVQ